MGGCKVFLYELFMNRDSRNRVIELIDSIILPLSYQCAEVEWVSHERILRVFIEFAEGQETIGMNDCMLVTRALSECEQLDDMVSGSYRLEVSSPGVERPLRTLAHFEGVKGKMVRVKLVKPAGKSSEVYGVVMDTHVDSRLVQLQTQDGGWEFSLADLHSAYLVYDW
jgi:ribosome maturation factor RimP